MLRQLCSDSAGPRHVSATLRTRRCCVKLSGKHCFSSLGRINLNRTSATQSYAVRHSSSNAIHQIYQHFSMKKIRPEEKYIYIKELQNSAKIGTTYPRKMDILLARDSCTCPLCVDPSSKQKKFQTSDIPSNIQATPTVDSVKGTLEITWTNDIPGFPEDHVTRFELKPEKVAWKNSLYHPLEPKERVPWDRVGITEKVKFIPYDRYMTDDSVLHDALEQLGIYGLVFLTDVPDSEQSVERIGGRIGILKDTFYGRTWDVKSVPDAKNIAYTDQRLGLHMDLMYVSNPPHLQLLHSLRARSPGGASLFSDSLRAAFKLAEDDEDAFSILCRFPVPFHYKNDGQSYVKWRPTIELLSKPDNKKRKQGSRTLELGRLCPNPPRFDDAPSSIKSINYSPPFQAPRAPSNLAVLGSCPQEHGVRDSFGAAQSTFRAVHDALGKFTALVEDPDAVFEHRLEEGQCVIFDNRRVLHARTPFDATAGERWLKGAYVDDDVFFSKWRVLADAAAEKELQRKAETMAEEEEAEVVAEAVGKEAEHAADGAEGGREGAENKA